MKIRSDFVSNSSSSSFVLLSKQASDSFMHVLYSAVGTCSAKYEEFMPWLDQFTYAVIDKSKLPTYMYNDLCQYALKNKIGIYDMCGNPLVPNHHLTEKDDTIYSWTENNLEKLGYKKRMFKNGYEIANEYVIRNWKDYIDLKTEYTYDIGNNKESFFPGENSIDSLKHLENFVVVNSRVFALENQLLNEQRKFWYSEFAKTYEDPTDRNTLVAATVDMLFYFEGDEYETYSLEPELSPFLKYNKRADNERKN